MANSKAISIRIPDQFLGKIDQLAEEKYKTHKGTANRSLVILDIISNYFDTVSDTNNIDKAEECQTLPDTVSTIEFNELRDIVDTLSNTVRRLEEHVTSEPDENPPVPSETPTEINHLSWVRFHKFIGIAAPDIKNRVNGERAISVAKENGLGDYRYDSVKSKFAPLDKLYPAHR